MNREGAKDARKAESKAIQIFLLVLNQGRGSQDMGTSMDIETIASKVVVAAIKVHTILGPGLLESAYQKRMEYDLKNDGMHVECEMVLPIKYGEILIDAGYRIDMIVENAVIIEHKTVDRLLPIHEAQLVTYLKMKNCKVGFLLNWNVPRMKDGIKRMVNNL